MKLGANDYLLKDRLTRLGTAVKQVQEKKQLIEERRRSRHALLKSKKRYRELFLKMSNGVVVYTVKDEGRDFVISDLNPAVERIEKVEKQSVLGKSVQQVFPGIMQTGLLEVFRQVWKTGLCTEQPVIFYQDARISGWRRNNVYKINHDEVVAVYEDMTEQVQAQKDLEASEAKYRGIVEHIGLGVTLVSPEMLVLELNPQMRKWFPKTGPYKRQVCYRVFNDPPGDKICTGCPIVATLRVGHPGIYRTLLVPCDPKQPVAKQSAGGYECRPACQRTGTTDPGFQPPWRRGLKTDSQDAFPRAFPSMASAIDPVTYKNRFGRSKSARTVRRQASKNDRWNVKIGHVRHGRPHDKSR